MRLLCTVLFLLATRLASADGPILPSAELKGSALTVPRYSPVALTHDGRTFALGGRTAGSVRLVDAASGQEGDQLRAGNIPLKKLQFLTGDQLLLGADTERVHLWDVRNRKLLTSCPAMPEHAHSQRLLAHAVSADGSILVTAVNNLYAGQGYREHANVQGWKLPEGELLWSKEYPVSVHASEIQLRLSRDALRVALWPRPGYSPPKDIVHFWDVKPSSIGQWTVIEREKTLTVPNWSIQGLTFTPDGNELILGIKQYTGPPKPGVRTVTAHLEETSHLTRVRYDTLEEIKRWEVKLVNALSVLIVNPSGTLIAGYDTGIHQFGVFDLQTGDVRQLGKIDYKNYTGWPMIWEMRFTKDNHLQLTLERNGQPQRWLIDKFSATELPKPPVPGASTAIPHLSRIEAMAFTPDGRLRSMDQGMLCTWDLKSNRLQSSKGIPYLGGHFRHSKRGRMLNHSWSNLRPTLSRDGRFLVRNELGACAALTNLDTGTSYKLDFDLNEETQGSLSVDFTPDSSRLLTIWSEGRPRPAVPGQPFVMDEAKMGVWDTATGKSLWTADCTAVTQTWFTADGKAVFSNGQHFDVDTGKPGDRVPGERVVHPLPVFSRDTRRAGVIDRGKIRVLDAQSSTLIDEHTIVQHSGRQYFVGFRPDGRSILVHLWRHEAAGGNTSELRWIELATHTPRATFIQEASARLYHPTLSPDASLLVASNDAHGIVRWDLPLALPKSRQLTPDELTKHWSTLGEVPAEPAWLAMRTLAADPDRAVPFLAEHLKDDPLKDIPQLLLDLDHSDFARREAATQKLARLGKRVEDALRHLSKYGSPETKRRTQKLLETLPAVDVHQARLIRTVETLEMIANAPARQLLTHLAKGPEADILTREAQESLRRLP